MDFKLFKFYKLSRTLQSLAFASIVTDKGELIYDGELVEGVEVAVEDEEGNGSPASDGEYEAEDKIIVVAEGKVVEIRAKESVEEPKEEPKPEEKEEVVEEPKEEPAQEEDKDAKIAEMEARINELKALVAERDARIAELEAELAQKNEELQMSAALPAKDVVKHVEPQLNKNYKL